MRKILDNVQIRKALSRTFIFLWVIVEFTSAQFELAKFFSGMLTIDPVGFPWIWKRETDFRPNGPARAALKNRYQTCRLGDILGKRLNLPSGNFSSKYTSQFTEYKASKLTRVKTSDFIFFLDTTPSLTKD